MNVSDSVGKNCFCSIEIIFFLFKISAGGLYRINPPPHYISVLRKDEGLADLYEDQL